MKRQKWNEGWKFWADKDSFALVWNVPENAREMSCMRQNVSSRQR